MNPKLWLLSVTSLLLSSCANVQLVAWEGSKYKFCTNPGNLVATQSDFNEAAEKQCKNGYTQIAGGYLSSGGSTISRGLSGDVRVSEEKQRCVIYQCR